MSEKICNNCGEQVQDSFAMELLKGYSTQAKRWFIICMVILVMWLSTIATFIWYLNQYDYSSYTVEQDTTAGGNANFIGNDGDVYNGLSESNGETQN